MSTTSEKARRKAEFGDFQTPPLLARQACEVLKRWGIAPASIVEPTCGVGNLLAAGLETFPTATVGMGVDINPTHIEKARDLLSRLASSPKVILKCADFFADFNRLLHNLPQPRLVIGNPPWVTNSHLGAIGGSNFPEKTNFQ